MNIKLVIFGISLSGLFFLGCASERKARQAEREKVSQASGLYCDFVNGEQFHDVDVQTNFVMAKKCDPSKPFSVTNYKNSSDIFGVVYCCNINRSGTGATASASAGTPKKEATPAVPAPEASSTNSVE